MTWLGSHPRRVKCDFSVCLGSHPHLAAAREVRVKVAVVRVRVAGVRVRVAGVRVRELECVSG